MTLKRYTSITAFVLTLFLVFSFVSVSAQETGGQEAGGQEGAAAASESPVPLDDPATIEAGQALFVGKLGCYGCHGQAGGGGMGPSLADNNWIYGGDEASIHESLVNGRPNGMPAFAEAATDEELWQVVAFVRSLSAAQ
jgi:cbb3-type cytochrome c oxidase subunit III